MIKLFEKNNSIVIENSYAEITVSKENALVEKITDKTTGKSIKSEADTAFFSLWADENTAIPCKALTLNGDIITAEFENGSFDVKAGVFDRYFTYELTTALPKGTFRAFIAHCKYDYDRNDRQSVGAVSIAMTVSANPVHFPNGYAKETQGIVYPHLDDLGAKIGIVIAPFPLHREIIKELCLTIDREKGIVSMTGGAWGRDDRMNFSNYTIQKNASRKYIEDNIDFFKAIGVDQVDINKGQPTTFNQGDFKFNCYKDAAEFKENVSDVLEKHGIATSLHTYSCYIEYNTPSIVANPKWQKQIKVHEFFTLGSDMTEDSDFVPTTESTAHTSENFNYRNVEIPFVLIDEEVIKIAKGENGFKVVQRGFAESKISAHKKGAEVRYLEGFYRGFCPEFKSELFYQVAKNMADAYNEGGFKMIYFDALDGLSRQCVHKHEYWYYSALFVHAVLKHCKTDPIMEHAAFAPSYWASRGRVGAWDVCRHGYRIYNNEHLIDNIPFIDAHNVPTMGWYQYYPVDENYPGNEFVKYEHTDTVHRLGSIALMYDFSTVFNDMTKNEYDRYIGLRRNIAIYKKYDDLRKSMHFSGEYRKKLMACPHEVHLIEKRGKKYSFIEKYYKTAKLYDLNDSERSFGEFKNPFGAQVPFIRIEAMLSTLENNPVVLLPIDEAKELTSQKLNIRFGGELDMTENLAKRVRIFGNGKGGKIGIKIHFGIPDSRKYALYVIDVDFKGWRDFILIEADNGERQDHPFEKGEKFHGIFRYPAFHKQTSGIAVLTDGDMLDVKMTSVIAYEHIYDVLKNPTVKIGDGEIMFECELKSTDFIEFDGETAKVIDRYGNERQIWYKSTIKAPRGRFRATLCAKSLNRCVPRAQLTFGFTGKEIK